MKPPPCPYPPLESPAPRPFEPRPEETAETVLGQTDSLEDDLASGAVGPRFAVVLARKLAALLREEQARTALGARVNADLNRLLGSFEARALDCERRAIDPDGAFARLSAERDAARSLALALGEAAGRALGIPALTSAADVESLVKQAVEERDALEAERRELQRQAADLRIQIAKLSSLLDQTAPVLRAAALVAETEKRETGQSHWITCLRDAICRIESGEAV